MRVTIFTHSIRSCWNHGNAHFLRGVVKALERAGHRVDCWEPDHGWSLANLLSDHGRVALDAFQDRFPDLRWHVHHGAHDVEPALDGADLVLVHEWTDPAVVSAIGRARVDGGRFTLLFHDTHHRAVTDREFWSAYPLEGYDGVLAFGESLAAVYRRRGWGDRVFTWHEAADVDVFHPIAAGERSGLVWIGNWGDGERSTEIEEFLLRPAAACGLPLDVYGVRYPDAALAMLKAHRARYRGWIANADAPSVFAKHLATVHVPRRSYVETLPGIPTIRVFEALACGIPLVSAPWNDCEGLFRPGQDFLVAGTGMEMVTHLRAITHDASLRHALAASGLARIRERHTCDHRVAELIDIVGALRVRTEGALT